MGSEKQASANGQQKKPFFETGIGGIIYLILTGLITYVLIAGGSAVGELLQPVFVNVASGMAEAGNTLWAKVLVTGAMYGSFIFIWIVVLAFLLIRKKDRFILKKLGHGGGNNFLMLLLGLVIGFAMNMSCALVAILRGDVKLALISFDFLPFIILILLVFIQSSAEELVFRGYYLQKIRQRYSNPWVAILVTALGFLAIHMGNPGVTVLGLFSVFLSGVLFAQITLYFDSIWMAMAIHTGWNFTQSILLGLPNSGQVVPYSTFGLDPAFSPRNSFAYSTSFGIEGTVTATILLMALIFILWFFWGRKKAA